MTKVNENTLVKDMPMEHRRWFPVFSYDFGFLRVSQLFEHMRRTVEWTYEKYTGSAGEAKRESGIHPC